MERATNLLESTKSLENVSFNNRRILYKKALELNKHDNFQYLHGYDEIEYFTSILTKKEYDKVIYDNPNENIYGAILESKYNYICPRVTYVYMDRQERTKFYESQHDILIDSITINGITYGENKEEKFKHEYEKYMKYITNYKVPEIKLCNLNKNIDYFLSIAIEEYKQNFLNKFCEECIKDGYVYYHHKFYCEVIEELKISVPNTNIVLICFEGMKSDIYECEILSSLIKEKYPILKYLKIYTEFEQDNIFQYFDWIENIKVVVGYNYEYEYERDIIFPKCVDVNSNKYRCIIYGDKIKCVCGNNSIDNILEKYQCI